MADNENFVDLEGEFVPPLEVIYNMLRLEGGSANMEADELQDLLDQSDHEEEPTPPTARTAAAAAAPMARKPIEEARPSMLPPKPKPTKLALALKYVKISVLVICLLISIILLAKEKEYKDEAFQVVLQPGIIKTVLISDIKDKTKLMTVKLKGPFILGSECSQSVQQGQEPPMLTVYVTERLNENSNERKIGDDWKICFINPAALDTVKSLMKENILHLGDRTDGSNVYLNFEMENMPTDVYVATAINSSPVDQNQGIIYGTVVLFFLYFMIVTEIIDRTFASLIAAAMALGVLALCNEKVGQNMLIKWIDVETLALLVGMMLLVSILAESGIFDYFVVFAYKVAKGRVWPLINCLSFFTAFLAMFLDSVTMMLLATPVTIRLCEVLSLDPVPILICMVLFANVGAATTPVGDPPNVIISLNPYIQKNNVNFGNFCLHMAPGVLFTLVQVYIHLRLLYRKPESLRLKNSKEITDLQKEIAVWERTVAGISPTSQGEDVAREAINDKIARLEEKLDELQKGGSTKRPTSFEETLEQLTKQYPIRDKPLLVKAGLAFCLVLFFFFTHSIPNFLHLSLGWSALIGAFLLLVLSDKRNLEALLVRIEWSTLLFFASLFIIMESLSLLGVIDLIGTFVVHVISSVEPDYQLTLAIVIVVWVSGIASAFLDNIPVTTMMVKIIIRLAEDKDLNLPLQPLVWSLAFGACFGGNGTLIGASANVVTAGVSEQHGYKISFVRFFLVCFPLTLGSLFVANAYLLVAHVVFKWHD